MLYIKEENKAFTLRLNKKQHEVLERRAKEENLSKNQYIVKLIELDGRDIQQDFKDADEILNYLIRKLEKSK